MNIADQFPELRGRELPSWLGQDIDDDVDLVASATKALAESLRGLDLAASLPGLIDLGFSSATVLEGGSLSADMSGLVKKFQAELQAAMPAALARPDWGTSTFPESVKEALSFTSGPVSRVQQTSR